MKLGKHPARHTLHSMRGALILAQHLNDLGSPPTASDDYVAAVVKSGKDWGMMGNDTLGDCVCADTGHTLMLRTANASTIVVPTDADVIALYEAVGGYNPANPDNTDNGCDESAMCDYLKATGFLGHKSDADGMIDPANLDHVKWAVQLMGHCRIGLNMPTFAMDQFDRNEPWDLNPPASQDIEGGHDVPIVKYDGQYFYVVTWGKLQAMTPAFFKQFADEAHAEVFFDWIKSTGTAPPGFDLEQLVSDLQYLS